MQTAFLTNSCKVTTSDHTAGYDWIFCIGFIFTEPGTIQCCISTGYPGWESRQSSNLSLPALGFKPGSSQGVQSKKTFTPRQCRRFVLCMTFGSKQNVDLYMFMTIYMDLLIFAVRKCSFLLNWIFCYKEKKI